MLQKLSLLASLAYITSVALLLPRYVDLLLDLQKLVRPEKTTLLTQAILETSGTTVGCDAPSQTPQVYQHPHSTSLSVKGTQKLQHWSPAQGLRLGNPTQ